MASLLKNQILKHLSKFTKNLSADKINLSTLRGEGELSNLELNEDILTQLLELPTWLRITKAVCTRVSVKIQWTKLKSQPICLYLDEVIIETETCEYPRPPNTQSQQTQGGKYGFVDRVMDGIYVHVNSVVVKLHSHMFHASLQLSRVKVQSMSPTWQTPTDLRSTRIRDPGRGEILLFKEIEWQTTRIEATAVCTDEDFLTPLRLIANQAKIRIVVKKKLIDSSIISSRLTLLLDDLLWVLTITQLKAAILYANSLKEVIERSSQQSKRLAAEKLKKQGHMGDSLSLQQQQQQRQTDRQESTTAKHFSRFDVLSTSYHLITSRFDLHLCDDSSPVQEDKRHWKISGGSMQITFFKISIDFYPFHPAGGERKLWHRYTDNVGSRNPWVGKLFAQFREEAVKLRKVVESAPMTSSSSAPSSLTSQAQLSGSPNKNLSPSHAQTSANNQGTRSAHSSPSHQQTQKSTRLLETCFVIKVEDMTVYMVSLAGKKRTGPNKLLCSDKRQLHLPPDMSVVHVEYTDYFFPEGLEYPVPHANMYVLVNPIRITLDFLTLLWSNVFLLTLTNSLDMDFDDQKPQEHVDIKVEMLMPRIVVPAEEKIEGQPDRPEAVQIQVSKLVVSNLRMEEKMTRDDLKTLLDEYKLARLFSQTDFPNDDANSSEQLIPSIFTEHALGLDDPYIDKAVHLLLSQSTEPSKRTPTDSSLHLPLHLPPHRLNCNSLKRAASSDIWSASAEQVWLEFLGIQNCKNRPAPFVEAIPVTVWLCSSPCASQFRKSLKSRPVIENGQSTKSLAKRNVDMNSSNQDSGGSGPTPSLSANRDICNHRGTREIEPNAVRHSGHQRLDNSTDPRHDIRNNKYQDLDGNSLPQTGRDDDRRPTRLPLSGAPNSPRLNRQLSRTDSLHESNPADPLPRSAMDEHTYDSGERSSCQQQSSEQYSGNYSQSQQRKDKQYHREDSRSSSSPPLDQSEKSNKRRPESKERRSAERRMRHSSSSSIERGHRGHDMEGRSNAEGQMSSESYRVNGRDVMRGDDYLANKDKSRESPHSHQRARHGSNSSTDRTGSSRSRERRNIYEAQVEDADRKLADDHQKEDRASPRDEFHQRSSREMFVRKSTRDGSRHSEKKYSTMDVYERSPVWPNKREMDGMPLSRKGFSRDRDGGMSDDAMDSRKRRQRSHSRGGESEGMAPKLDRNEDGDSYRAKYAQDDPDCRSRLSEHLRSKHLDADCDNDRFSQTSHSSLDTICKENGQSTVVNECKVKVTESQVTSKGESPGDKSWARVNQRSPPDGCKSQDDVYEKSGSCQLEADRKTCILAKVQGKVRAQLNHFQYLFLLRLSESFSAFQNDLSADLASLEAKASAKRKSHRKGSPQPPQLPPITVIPIMLRELEFAVVCPYQMHQRTFSDDFSLVSPFLIGMTGGQDAVFGDDGDGTCFPQLVDSMKGQRSKDDSALKPFHSSISFKSSSSSQLETVTHLGPPSDFSQRNRAFTSGSTALIPPGNVTVPVVAPSFNSTDIMSQSLNSIGKDSGIGIDRKPQKQQHTKAGSAGSSTHGGKAGASDMKKTFTSAFSSLTDRLKHMKESLDESHSVGDDADTLSIRTDTSDDDFEHMSLDDVEEVPAFYHDPPPPELTPVGGDNYSDIGDLGDSVSMYAESSTTKGKEMVYVVLFKLDHTEAIMENRSNQSLSKAQVAKLGSLQLGNISYDDFQARFSTVKGYIQEDISDAPPLRYPIKVKACKPTPDPNSPAAGDPGHLHVQAHDLSLQFKMSGLICLSDFSEDEKLPEALPISVEVRDLLLVLEEDRPPVNVTSPGSLPVNLHIRQLSIEREKDGIFYIAGLPNSTSYVYNPSTSSAQHPPPPPPPPAVPKPVLANAVTSPIMSPDGTMALLMASQNETVLLRRQLEEVRRANRLYEHQILQWRDMQDKIAGVAARPGAGPLQGRVPISACRKRPSFTADSLSSSPSSLGQSDRMMEQSRLSRDDVDPMRDELERENLLLAQQVARLEDDLLTASKEKESLLQTLQLLQEELLSSELKQRSKSKV